MTISRRESLRTLGIALTSAGLASTGLAATAPAGTLLPPDAYTLGALTRRLGSLPRRRDFKSVPMILDRRSLWDAEALDAVLQYPGGPKQSWDNTEISGPWLSVMRNAINSQIWAFRHPNFLCVSVTHGTAQFALYSDAMWEKYGLAKLAGGNVTGDNFVTAPPAAAHNPKDYQDTSGVFSARANSLQVLQRRGAVFMACHNAMWEMCERLIAADVNPDKLTTETMCAEFTDHLIPGVVLTPGAVGTLVELARAGFSYAR